MRKVLKIHVGFSMLLWVVTLITFLVGQSHPFWFVVALALGVTGLFMTLVVSTRWTWSGLDQDWFKTQEELRQRIGETKEEWDNAHKLIKILGEHEAIKLWNENKAKGKATVQ